MQSSAFSSVRTDHSKRIAPRPWLSPDRRRLNVPPRQWTVALAVTSAARGSPPHAQPRGSVAPVPPASRSWSGARWVAAVALGFIVVVVVLIIVLSGSSVPTTGYDVRSEERRVGNEGRS